MYFNLSSLPLSRMVDIKVKLGQEIWECLLSVILSQLQGACVQKDLENTPRKNQATQATQTQVAIG